MEGVLYMDFTTTAIKKTIEEKLDNGYKRFIIFPFGDVGIKAKEFLNSLYGIEEEMIIDNHLCKYNSNIKSIDILKEINTENITAILSTTDAQIYHELRNCLLKYFDDAHIGDIYRKAQSMLFTVDSKKQTKCGKYSYGPLTNHYLVEEVGAFCSFAEGTDVLQNHAIDYITTHPMIFHDKEINSVLPDFYINRIGCKWYFEGIRPKGIVRNLKRIHIGNDVWLGKNVLITNAANIGNGVIAGAGAVITKSVPDYAVIGGVPARIIKYRYAPKQIDALNRIAWWEWSDDEIRERFEDFYLPIEEFIAKYQIDH